MPKTKARKTAKEETLGVILDANWLQRLREALIAASGQSIDDGEADWIALIDTPADSCVGRMCITLVRAVETVLSLQIEPRDHIAIMNAACRTMVVWYFG